MQRANDTTLAVHIGYYKTGTTFLQNVIFPSMDLSYHNIDTSTEILKDVIFTDDLDYHKDYVISALENAVKPNAVNLFSFESLVGPMFMYPGINRSNIANRLYELGFRKVIITLRSQYNLIDSFYRQYIQVGGVLKFRKYLESDFFNDQFFLFAGFVQHYQNIFGKENIKIVLQEDLKSHKEKEVNELCSFLGSSIISEEKGFSNISMSNGSISLLRIVNHFTANYFRPSNLISNHITTFKVRYLLQRILDPFFIKFFSNHKSYIKKYKLEDYVFEKYADNNTELNNDLNLGMEKYNYPLRKI